LALASARAAKGAETATLVINAGDRDANPFHLDRADGPDYLGQATRYRWDPAGATLTLDGFQWVTTAATAVRIVGAVTLDLAGATTFRSAYRGAEDTVGLETGIEPVTLRGGRLAVAAGDSERDSTGLFAHDSVTVAADVTATAGRARGLLSAGVRVFAGPLTVTGALTARGGEDAVVSQGVAAWSGVTVDGGTLAAHGGVSADTSVGLEARAGLLLTSGGVTLTGHTRAAGRRTVFALPATYEHQSNAGPVDPGAWVASADRPFAYSDAHKYIGLRAAAPRPTTTAPPATSATPATPAQAASSPTLPPAQDHLPTVGFLWDWAALWAAAGLTLVGGFLVWMAFGWPRRINPRHGR
jgi:hypothetical protein